jgi:hypothetical protein
LLPTIVAGVYAVYRTLTGDEIGRRGGYATWVSKLFTMFVWYVLLLVYFVKTVQLLVQRPGSQLLVVAAMCFGYLGAGYATTLNNHTPAALVGLMAFYHALRARRQPHAARHWIAAGLAAGAIPAFDLPFGALTAGLFVYLFFADWRRALRLFVPAMLPTLALHLGLSWAISGSIVPVYMRAEVYQYPGSYWATPHGVFALKQPKWLYGFHLLLGHHGFFTRAGGAERIRVRLSGGRRHQRAERPHHTRRGEASEARRGILLVHRFRRAGSGRRSSFTDPAA